MEEYEVELIDYLRVIWKRKGLILGGTVLAVFSALVISLFLPKTYEVSRTLEIGKIPGKEIESREAVMARLKDHRLLTRLIREFQLDMEPDEVSRRLVSIDSKRGGPHVRYTVKAPDPELATRIADWLAENVVTEHRRIFTENMEIIKAYKEGLEADLRKLNTEISSMRGTLKNLIKDPGVEAPAVILLQANIEERQRTLVSLKRELKETEMAMTGISSNETSVISADAPPTRPVKPKVKLNTALAGVLGLMIFTFLAFFLEYIEKIRQKGQKGTGYF